MDSKKNQRTTSNSIVADLSIMEYSLQCAADMALCLSIAAGSGNVPEEQMGNALYGLHEYLSSLYSTGQAIAHSTLNQ